MSARIVITFHQGNPLVGDIPGNAEKALAALADAARDGADLLMLPELFICGYPPEDLILRPAFIDACMAAVRELAAETASGPAMLIGAPWREEGRVCNAMALLADGEVAALRFKHDLPNYGVFDEKRVFAPGPLPEPVDFRGVKIGLPVCEDIWTEPVARHLKARGADILLVANGSPFETEKHDTRLKLAADRVAETGLPLVYLNLVGGQDELVFDGGSFALNPRPGREQPDCADLAWRMESFVEQTLTCTVEKTVNGWRAAAAGCATRPEGEEAIWRACVLGTRDYVEKNRFPGVVLGLSGGIDSAVVAAMAADALGPERVWAVMLPYEYTAPESIEDARACAAALRIRHDVVPIHRPVEGFTAALQELFADREPDVTEENIQSRARGTLLMAISNKFGPLVLTTGNKSEMSVGYATLYGDMNGGFNPLKDVYKTQVYALAKWRNRQGEVIPRRIITRPPSAELRPGQTDQDSLPPYEVLDAILEGLVEEELSVDEIVRRGHDRALVARIQHLLYVAEYKRRQAAPGVKITRRNFGRDRRWPITNAFRENGRT